MSPAAGRSKYLALAVLLLPSLAGMVVFLMAPVLSSLVLSFSQWDLIGEIHWVGIDNYLTALADPAVLGALRNTLTFILGYLPSVVIIALGLALLLNRRIRGRVVFRAIYFVPVVTSWVAVSLIWKWLLNPQYGLINFALGAIGIKGPGWLFDPAWAMTGVILTSVWKDIGFVTVIYLAGLQDIPEPLYEAAALDGATPWQRFWAITFPMLAPTTFFVTTISLISSFQVFDQVWIMTQGGPAGATSVMVELIYKNAFSYYKMGYASAISWVLFALIFAVTIAQNLLQKKLDRSDG
ncbi:MULTISPECIES: sugar ABC transporter permease [unclassified Devosia]|uniref:carbohydrate ABC transporter permease n=1 Tax=unclassified Devosia TaxID=196773 RepID=UPI0009601C1D|nr:MULTISPECIES: sugar ABC transporter permease [unclassified Devosia]MBN9362249.1 sugar ABC transporter permease [Devosia sp.]OJX24502.1 MAG: sugar ABC transporter permease [Devosia sp. 66-14]